MEAQLKIRNRTRGGVLACEGRAGLSSWSRLRGLLGSPPLRQGQGLLLDSCSWIHTLGMRFPIDVLYLNRERVVLRTDVNMRPNRVGPLVWRACSVVELPVGAIERTGTRIGDRLEITQSLCGEGNEP
jgi:uncharacterized membrane protein (UPF0127 family)